MARRGSHTCDPLHLLFPPSSSILPFTSSSPPPEPTATTHLGPVRASHTPWAVTWGWLSSPSSPECLAHGAYSRTPVVRHRHVWLPADKTGLQTVPGASDQASLPVSVRCWLWVCRKPLHSLPTTQRVSMLSQQIYLSHSGTV